MGVIGEIMLGKTEEDLLYAVATQHPIMKLLAL